MIRFNRFKDGMHFAVTFSFDDGNIADRRVIAILNKYKLKGTFNLDSGRFGDSPIVTEDELCSLYEGHEIASHTLTHPHLERLPVSYQTYELLKDKENLEKITGNMIRGFAYPYSAKNEETISALKSIGFEYARLASSTYGFSQPENFYLWEPSCHFKDFDSVYPKFTSIENQSWNYGGVFYIWGHSFELKDEEAWKKFEEMCEEISERENVWYVTNIELCEYMKAQRALLFSADNSIIYNPSACDVWISCDGEPVCVKSGEYTKVK